MAFLGPFVGVSANADAMMPDPLPDEFRQIPFGQIIEPWVVLRVVNRESVEYLELRDSLAVVGPLNSICVRPSVRRPGHYEVVDGLYRYTAACELRLPALPCIVKHNLTDDDVLAHSDSGECLEARDDGVGIRAADQTDHGRHHGPSRNGRHFGRREQFDPQKP